MACDTLSSELPGKVFPRGSPEYIESTSSYFTAFGNKLSPVCIVQPSSSKDVSKLIKHFRASGTKFAVRGGGHTPWGGAANIQDGITVDMRNILGVSLSQDKKIVSIGTGEHWGSVYKVLESKKLATVGGRVSKVGVTGLVLGGGWSFFSAQTGFVCDNVISFEVVLASGQIVQASKETNSDLFTALKGGSTNFGIVTRFDLPTFPSGPMWGGITAHPATVVNDFVREFYDFITSSNPDEHAHVIASVGWSADFGMEMAITGLYHTNTQTADPPSSLIGFTSLEPNTFSTLRAGTLVDFTEEQSTFTVDGARQLFFTTSVMPHLDMMLKIVEISREGLKQLQHVEKLSWSLVFQSLTKQMLVHSAERGENSLGVSPDDGPMVNMLLNPTWKAAKDDDRVISVALEVIEKTEKLAAQLGKGAKYRFLNYGYKTQNVYGGLDEKGIQKMQKVSKKYDPEGFFQSNFVGEFKLPTSWLKFRQLINRLEQTEGVEASSKRTVHGASIPVVGRPPIKL
ncbi:FAD-binding domain-containing protein [Delitschia confertaspora ATCC 74209]|uniref:FAD-binding domain-containing protein n=1 Tax=Delitschia confertaspora ATCC 74209 TaxID=1513339 RepID=A0A9P4MSA9_9PLEO|nr:FAD-binding domain-containing protein [Delitschia confertaspora ATCC 74209]